MILERPCPRTPVLQLIRTTRDVHNHVVEILYVTALADRNTFIYENLPINP